jgi:hypothetical protein
MLLCNLDFHTHGDLGISFPFSSTLICPQTRVPDFASNSPPELLYAIKLGDLPHILHPSARLPSRSGGGARRLGDVLYVGRGEVEGPLGKERVLRSAESSA